MRFNVEKDVEKATMIECEKKKYYLYIGSVNGRPTQWLTETKWNYNINVMLINNDMIYLDDEQRQIHVFEKGDEDWIADVKTS